MKKATVIGMSMLFLIVLSLFTASQLDLSDNSKSPQIVSIIIPISSSMDLETKETCTTEFYDVIESLLGTCTAYSNLTSCLNTSGPNTNCAIQETSRNYECQIGSSTIHKNKTTCIPTQELLIEIDDGATQKTLNYSQPGNLSLNIRIPKNAPTVSSSSIQSITFALDDLEIEDFSLANQTGSSVIFSLDIQNTLTAPLTAVNWSLDTKNGNIINSTLPIALNASERLFIFVGYNFTTSGTFAANATLRNGTLADSQVEVVIV